MVNDLETRIIMKIENPLSYVDDNVVLLRAPISP